INKTGPNLNSNKDSVKDVLKCLEDDIVTLANNHILDYDEEGLKDTLSFCYKNKIKTVGAKMNLKDASKTLFIETEESRISIVNFTENEWTCAGTHSAGANSMNLIDNFKQIKEAKEKA